jgi:hypothetical protein
MSQVVGADLSSDVTPAQGVHVEQRTTAPWIAAFAGMTDESRAGTTEMVLQR